MKKVHFIAIGGIGVSSLAQYYLAKGWKVSGSDLSKTELTDELKKLGIKISIGQKAQNINSKIDRVIHSAAIKAGNAEYDQAKELGLEILSYAEALGELTREYYTISVSGAHGKSTTTSMLSLVLIKAGFDPTVIVGTKLKEFGGRNFRLGQSKYLIIEADEYNRSFLNYNPDVAVVTNIDREHLDTYGNLNEIIKTFTKYFFNIKKGGALILNKEDANSLKALAKNKNKFIKIIKYTKPKKNLPLKVFGDFNQINAEAVWQVAKMLKIPEPVFEKAICGFSGSWRRMEELSPLSKTSRMDLDNKYYSDYAHHPTEILATIKAFKNAFPKRKLTVVFQAHQIERLNNLFKDFVEAFDLTDELILLPAYQVAGREIKEDEKKDVSNLFVSIQKRRKIEEVQFLTSFREVINLIKDYQAGTVLFMGAGSIDKEVRKYFGSKLF